MSSEEFFYEIVKSFGFRPTDEQENALQVFTRFVFSGGERSLMILRGSAGTGKTTLASAIVRTLQRLRQRTVLLAPTGRAAKVFALNSGRAASTIHRKIYRQQKFKGFATRFGLAPNMHQRTLFIVDESSMINYGASEFQSFRAYSQSSSRDRSEFGSGNLLDDLMKFVYNDKGCRLMLIGDKAQLPPVGSTDSVALDDDFMKSYGLQVFSCDLNEVLRQAQDSGILWNATRIRRMITRDEMTQLPKIKFCGFPDIHLVKGDELIEQISSSYSHVGIDETMVVCRSNKRAYIYNRGIRSMVLGKDSELESGDRLMVVKNHYLCSGGGEGREGIEGKEGKEGKEGRDGKEGREGKEGELDFIANGDMIVLRKLRNVRELYGFRFADAVFEMPDYDNREMDMIVVLDSLSTEAPALTHEQMEQLFQNVLEDYQNVTMMSDRMAAVKDDPYYNALQIKYAYAVTCHKSQGGQWEHIYLDQGYMTDDMLTDEYIHWLYTAFTRATKELYLVNWPSIQVDASR